MAASNRRQQAAPATATQTQTGAVPRQRIAGTLRLRGEPSQPRRRIQWADDVVDNEGLGRKKSKGTCIRSTINLTPRRMLTISNQSAAYTTDLEQLASRLRRTNPLHHLIATAKMTATAAVMPSLRSSMAASRKTRETLATNTTMRGRPELVKVKPPVSTATAGASEKGRVTAEGRGRMPTRKCHERPRAKVDLSQWS